MKFSLGGKETLAGRASRALGLSFVNYAAGRLGTLAIGVVLARLLGPHAFGTYAVAYVALLAVLSFNELGVSLAIVRWPGEPREIAPTVTTISCASSVLIYIGLFFSAPAFAGAMGAPAASPVIRVLATSVLINGIAAVPAALLQRYFSQGRKMIADQANNWLTAGVSVALAWSGFGAMSLGIGQAAGALGSGILLVALSPMRLRFGFRRETARSLMVFGLPLAGSSLIVFLVGNVDNFTVGRILGPTALGFYVLAWNLSSWPVNMFSQPVRSVAPALFARLQHDRTAMRTAFLTGAGLLGAVTLPVCLLFSGSAVPLIRFVYGPEWVPAAQALAWLALLGALRILFELSYDYFVVLGRSRVVFTVQLAWLAALVPALIVGARMDGIRGASIAGVAVAMCVVLPWYLSELHKVGIRRRALATQLWMPLLGAAGVGLFAVGLGGVLRSNLVVLMVSGVVAVGTIGLLIFNIQPELAMLRPAFGNAEQPAAAAAGADSGAGEPAEPRDGGAAQLAGEPANGRAADRGGGPATGRGADSAAPGQAPAASGTDVTVPFAIVRERPGHAQAAEETTGAADATIPLPIFRDAGGPLPVYRDVTGLVPMYQDSAGHPRRDHRSGRHAAGRHGAAWMADHDSSAGGGRPAPVRRGRPGETDETDEVRELARRQHGHGDEG